MVELLTSGAMSNRMLLLIFASFFSIFPAMFLIFGIMIRRGQQNNNLTYDKEKNSLAYFSLKFPEDMFSWHVWINIEKDGNLFIKGTGNTEVGKYVRELHLIRQK